MLGIKVVPLMYKIVMEAERDAIKKINENKKMNTLPKSYDIVLMSVEKIDLARLQQVSKENGNQPVLVKHGDQISIYGESPGGQEWKITSLDATTLEGITFPATPKAQEVTDKMLQEITSKNGHPTPEEVLFYRKVRENIVKKVEEDQKKKIDTYALCDTIETYQSMYMHAEVLGSNTPAGNVYQSSSLVEPISLEEQGGKKGVFRCSGIYTEEELTIYLSTLRNLFMEENFPHPISIQLSGEGHAITIGFDKKTEQWIYIDANKSFQYISDNEKMSATILKGLSSKNPANNLIGIASRMYIAAYNKEKENNIDLIKPFITKLNNNPNWKEIHAVSKETINRKDMHGGSLFGLAVKNGEPKKAKTIYKLTKNNPNKKRDKKGIALAKKHEKKFFPLELDSRQQEKKRFDKFKNFIPSFFKKIVTSKDKKNGSIRVCVGKK